MKLVTVIFASSMLALAPAAALAQSSPSPNNQSGPSVSPSVQTPTDPGTGSETGNTKGTPERGTMKANPGTTGAGANSMDTTAPQSPGAKEPMSKEKK